MKARVVTVEIEMRTEVTAAELRDYFEHAADQGGLERTQRVKVDPRTPRRLAKRKRGR